MANEVKPTSAAPAVKKEAKARKKFVPDAELAVTRRILSVLQGVTDPKVRARVINALQVRFAEEAATNSAAV